MPTADMLAPDNRIFALHIGESGTGKTCAAAFYPKPLYWFDIDKRLKGILGMKEITTEMRKQISFDQYDSSGEGIVAKLNKKFEMLEITKPFPFKTIVFDGLSSASNWFIDDALTFTGSIANKAKNSGEKTGLSGHKKIGTIQLPGWDEFGYEQKAFSDMMLFLKSLPCNVVVTGHWLDRYDDKGVVTGKKINLRDRVSPHVMKWFDEIYFFDKGVKAEAIPGVGVVQKPTFKVIFRNELARTTFPELPYEVDWTDRDFYEILTNSMSSQNKELIGA